MFMGQNCRSLEKRLEKAIATPFIGHLKRRHFHAPLLAKKTIADSSSRGGHTTHVEPPTVVCFG
jgi:hypothetical protein